jgi:hypothetical protein
MKYLMTVLDWAPPAKYVVPVIAILFIVALTACLASR